MRRGKVYRAGGGPGNPELPTVRALQTLEEADVVVCDCLVSAVLLANPAATLINAGKAQGDQEPVQPAVFRWLLHYADRADVTVRLKSGDPAAVGRCGEQLTFLASFGVEAEVIPGISFATAGPTNAGMPLTYPGVSGSFAVLAGDGDITAAAPIPEGWPADLPIECIERANVRLRSRLGTLTAEMATAA